MGEGSGVRSGEEARVWVMLGPLGVVVPSGGGLAGREVTC